MRLNIRPALRSVGTFLRKNDTKILKAVSYIATAAAMSLAVKAGMDAEKEILEKEEELQFESPDEVLPTKEKVKIVVRKVLPAGVMVIAGTVANELLYHTMQSRITVATAACEFATAKVALANNSANDTPKNEGEVTAGTEGSKIVIPEELKGLSNIEFDVFEPISQQVIHHVTNEKLAITQFVMNKCYQINGCLCLDWIIQSLGGHALPPHLKERYMWQQDFYDYEGIVPRFIEFLPTVDGNRMILRFSIEPDCIDDKLLDKFVS